MERNSNKIYKFHELMSQDDERSAVCHMTLQCEILGCTALKTLTLSGLPVSAFFGIKNV